MSASWKMVNPHPKFSYRWARFNMRLAALDWRYWSARNKTRAMEWLESAIDWRLTAKKKEAA